MMKLFVVVALLSITGMECNDEEVKRTFEEYKHLGCYTDKAARAIPKHLWTYIFTSPGGVIKKCADLAEFNGYKVFGVQYGKQCFSGPSAEKTYDQYGSSSQCSNGVGGSWANDVYAFPEEYHNGCYKDEKEGRAFPKYLGKFPAERAVSKCAALAEKEGFPVYAVQFGGECWTGPESEQDFDKYGKSDGCENGVGGTLANDVYSLKPYRHVGCYSDHLFTRAISWLIGTFPSATAVNNCAYTAKKKGYKGFGVQFGGQCFGSTGAHHESVYGKYGKSDKCKGGVGGWFANDVYLFF
ncbi:uncharacterized protein LOC116308716 [Actinia tenebrosa]|uniref:Uncharacterized protein LOC116308716 n=1 Tax=Actinia tenebrosa TaxID=6105 RepID=A0A6P8JFB5_ACTTE|nr:uncharacterized protein LOC116308716 [Actinia tenebrosa]